MSIPEHLRIDLAAFDLGDREGNPHGVLVTLSRFDLDQDDQLAAILPFFAEEHPSLHYDLAASARELDRLTVAALAEALPGARVQQGDGDLTLIDVGGENYGRFDPPDPRYLIGLNVSHLMGETFRAVAATGAWKVPRSA